MKLVILLVLILCTLTSPSYADEPCAYSANRLKAKLEVIINQLKDGSFQYEYFLTSTSDIKREVHFFQIEKMGEPLQIETKDGYRYVEAASQKNYHKWSKNKLWKTNKGAKPQKRFTIFSKLPPGPVKVRYRGKSELGYNVKVYSPYPRIEKMFCPGFWAFASSAENDTFISDLTTGPVSSDRLSPALRIRIPNSKKWSGGVEGSSASLLQVSPLDKGLIEILLVGDKNFDVETLDIKTIEFGRGKAKPLSNKITNTFMNGTDPTLKALEEESFKNVFMTFSIQDINVLCELDRALFLTGKTKDGKKVFTGVKIDTPYCNTENFAKEVEKMRGNQQH